MKRGWFAKSTLDARTIAERMNARPLPSDVDGGEWGPGFAKAGDWCDGNAHPLGWRELEEGTPVVLSGGGAAALLVCCLPCAVAECRRAEEEAR